MIAVTGPLEYWSNAEGGSHYIVIPEETSTEIKAHSMLSRRGFGSVRVECSIDPSTGLGQAVTWRTSVFPRKGGGYFLPVKIDVCRRAGLAAGDEMTVELELV